MQCMPQIPASALVVNSSATLLSGGEIAWVCSGATITDQGGADTLFLEKNVTCYSNGGGAVIFAKTGSTVVLNGGSEQVYYESQVNIVNMGSAQLLSSCSSVIFDYSKAPAPGCQTVGVVEKEEADHIILYPNPASEILNVELQNGERSTAVTMQVYNSIGSRVYSSVTQIGRASCRERVYVLV